MTGFFESGKFWDEKQCFLPKTSRIFDKKTTKTGHFVQLEPYFARFRQNMTLTLMRREF